jgi:serine/threonine-protein kinase
MERGRRIGRYVIFDQIAAGGTATVHLGRRVDQPGVVAIKCLQPRYSKEAEFVAMLTDEARLVSRMRHPNVASIIEIVQAEGELFLVMEYVHGEPLSRLLRQLSRSGNGLPVSAAAAILIGVLRGLDAAHEATADDGSPLGVVHRDVSPQNIIVGVDGVAKLIDFGVAKAVGRLQTTREGEVKGKTAYMSPEQLRGDDIDRRCDVYAASIVLWEALTGHRLFVGESTSDLVLQILDSTVPRPSQLKANVPEAIDRIVLRGLSREREERFSTAGEMAAAIEQSVIPAPIRDVGIWVSALAAESLAKRAALVRAVESP